MNMLRPRKMVASLAAGVAMLGFSTSFAAAEEITVTLNSHITSIDGIALSNESGAIKQLFQRYGVSLDDDGNHVAFYSDVISTTIESGVLYWETHGIYHFPNADDPEANDSVFLHTIGSADLTTGVWFWDVSEVTGGTGRFENVTSAPRVDVANEYAGDFGCFNPANDPVGFPNVVVCHVVLNLTF